MIRRAASPRAWRRACARVAPEAGDRPAAPIVYFGHGTTVATNALIQHRGVKTGLVTTDGFRDLLEIGRQKRPDLYDIQADKPQTLVPRDLRLEVPERVRHTGEIDTPLDEDEDARRRADPEGCRRAGGRRVVPLRLHPARPRAARGRHPARGAARRLHLGRPRDRARVPRVRAAVDGGAERLSRAGDGPLHPSPQPAAGGARHDGRAAPDAIQRRRHRLSDRCRHAGAHRAVRPRRPAWSAPRRSARWRASPDLITFDMGGTSTDVALLQDGRCRLAAEATVHGYPIKAPMLDIHTVGAGGGSIAYIDSRRPAEGRAALVRRRSRPGLLRQGQRGARRHRRQRGAADPQPRAPAGRPHEDPPAISAERAVGRLAERLGLGIDGDGAGHPVGRHRQHGARDPRHFRAARPRSARLHADGVRRRRAPARRAARPRARHGPRAGAGQSRHPVRHGPAADRPARRLRA